MYPEDENIILFPKWKQTLKEESLQDLQAKRYNNALEKLNQLINYNVQEHEILIGKMMCLMELGRYEEAEDFCEEIIKNKDDEHYYHYVHIYLTILFQSNKYTLLMERIEEELSSKSLPSELREQFLMLYAISEKEVTDFIEEKTPVYLEELFEAVQAADHRKQWRIITKLRTMKMKQDKSVMQLLTREDVHPVIKTAIFMWLQVDNYSNLVNVQKLGQELQVRPIDIPEIKDLDIYKKVSYKLRNLEQKNPILNQFLLDSLYRYLYVVYPILPSSKDTDLIANSLLEYNHYILNMDVEPPNDPLIEYYKDEIIKGEKLYLSIIED